MSLQAELPREFVDVLRFTYDHNSGFRQIIMFLDRYRETLKEHNLSPAMPEQDRMRLIGQAQFIAELSELCTPPEK